MSQSIFQELDFLLHTFLLGAMITILYDTLRIIRRVVRHGSLWIAIEDMGFWIVCSIVIFNMLMEENNGTLRWFAVLGSLLGMVNYKLTFGKIYVKYTTLFIQWMIKWIGKAVRFLLRPICFVLRKLYRQARKVKKTLTAQAKMVKIMLCKR